MNAMMSGTPEGKASSTRSPGAACCVIRAAAPRLAATNSRQVRVALSSSPLARKVTTRASGRSAAWHKIASTTVGVVGKVFFLPERVFGTGDEANGRGQVQQ